MGEKTHIRLERWTRALDSSSVLRLDAILTCPHLRRLYKTKYFTWGHSLHLEFICLLMCPSSTHSHHLMVGFLPSPSRRHGRSFGKSADLPPTRQLIFDKRLLRIYWKLSKMQEDGVLPSFPPAEERLARCHIPTNRPTPRFPRRAQLSAPSCWPGLGDKEKSNQHNEDPTSRPLD